MTIGLVYAMPGEIETLLTDETRTPIRTGGGRVLYQIRPTSSPAAAASARSTPPWAPSCSSASTTRIWC